MIEPTSLDRRTILKGSAMAVAASAYPAWAAQQLQLETVPVTINTRAITGHLPHIWEECVGSDRAAITLRESWRSDLDRWKHEAGTKRVRFHGIFCDEMGVFAPSILNRAHVVPNFQRVDQVYDGLLERGVSPFVELSFMPKQLASGGNGFFFYGMNISPPKSNDDWAAFVKVFVTHLIERYGINAVKDWPIEVWNEPNLSSFWSGTKQQYFDMYKATAVAIKSIDPRIQVGGPSTAQAEWIPEFAAYCAQNNTPVDFFSSHVYSGDSQSRLFGKGVNVPQNDVIPKTVAQLRQQIDASAFKGKPLWMSEWSSDSPAMIAHILTNCLGLCQAMSPWALSEEFEELGVPDYILKEGDGGWGMVTAGIAKPSFNTFKLMHALGNQRLATEGPALASLRDGKVVAAMVWNLAETKQPSGIPGASHVRTVKGDAKRFAVEFAGARPGQRARIRYVDQVRGSPMPAWREMGSPQYPNPKQLEQLRHRADIQPPQLASLDSHRRLTLTLPPEGVALIELLT